MDGGRQRAWIVAAALSLATCGGRTLTLANRDGSTAVDAPRPKGGLFAVCLGQDECQSGYTCLCGICTVTCTAQRCSDLAPGVACSDGIPFTSACGLTVPPAPCVRSCQSDDGCRSLNPTAVCVTGWCRIPQETTVVDGSVVSCDDRSEAFWAEVRPALESADRSCSTDVDCDSIGAGNACFGNSCPSNYLSKKAVAQIRELLLTIENRDCESAFRAGCVGQAMVHGCPAIFASVCVNGQCKADGPF